MSQENNFSRNNILERSFSYAWNNNIPLVSTIELTQVCNFSCHHCYNFDRSGPMPEKTKKEQMSPVEIHRLIEDLKKLGTLYLNFSGGEALIHPRINDFIEHASKLGMETTLKTNGVLLTEEKLEELIESGLCGIEISLYGASEESYRILTETSGSFEKVVASLGRCTLKKIVTKLNIILHRYNVSEISEMIDLAKKFNMPFEFSTEITARYDKTESSRAFEITSEQFTGLLLGEFSQYFSGANEKGGLQCSCARTVCGINSMGEVFPCIGAPILAGNVKQQSIVDIWHESTIFKKIRGIKQSDFKDCQVCDVVSFCNRSSGSTYVNTGNYLGCDPKTLEQSQLKRNFSTSMKQCR